MNTRLTQEIKKVEASQKRYEKTGTLDCFRCKTPMKEKEINMWQPQCKCYPPNIEIFLLRKNNDKTNP